jgi:hypothetical protein
MRRTLIYATAAAVALAVIGYAVYDNRLSDDVSEPCIRVTAGDSPDTVTGAVGSDPSSTVDEGDGTELWTWPGGWVRFQDGEATHWHSLVYGTPTICDD